MSEKRKCWYDRNYYGYNINTFKKTNVAELNQFILSEQGLMAIIEFGDGHVELIPSYKIRFFTDTDKEKLNIGC